MKKGKAIRTLGILTTTASILSGCVPTTVYGPPPETKTPVQEEQQIPEPVYGPPETKIPVMKPATNMPVEVYGPPSYFGMPEGPDEEPELPEDEAIHENG